MSPEPVQAIDWTSAGVLVVFIVVWSTLMLWAVKRISAGLESKLDGHIDEFKALEKRINELEVELPKEYVRRDDWIRFGCTIDTKIDRLHERFNDLWERLS